MNWALFPGRSRCNLTAHTHLDIRGTEEKTRTRIVVEPVGPAKIDRKMGDLNLKFSAHRPHQLTNPPDSLGELLSFGLWMRKQGYRGSTIRYTIQALRSIARRAAILDPESAKAYLASAVLSESRKEKLSDDLARFYRYRREPFDKPRYRGVEKLPFIPLESEVDQLISGVGRKLTVFLQLLKETGMRPGEAWNLKWIDLDPSNRTVCVSDELQEEGEESLRNCERARSRDTGRCLDKP